MKKQSIMRHNFLYVILAFLGMVVASCSDNDLDSLTGKYKIYEVKSNQAADVNSIYLKRGVKSLSFTVVGDNGNSVKFSLGSNEWLPEAGGYSAVDEVSQAATYSAVANLQDSEQKVVSGTLTVAAADEGYDVSGVLQTDGGNYVRVAFSGPIAFVVGEDTPEASGYTMTLKTETVSVTDWTTGQTTQYPELTKYVLGFNNPEGKAVGEFHLINKKDMKAAELAGTYRLQSNPAEAGLCDAGWTVPQYYMAGGTYYVDADGVNQYATAGDITLAVDEDADGNVLFSVSGAPLSTTTADATQTSATGSVNIKYASYSEQKGTVMRDITIDSKVLGTTMKYSVYLPEGYDGQTKLPVLYLLHGYGGNNNSWLDDGNMASLTSAAISAGTVGKMIVVMPDGQTSFYCNGYPEGQLNYEDFFVDELIPAVEKTFNTRTDRAGRAIGGLSMGGYGTLLHAFKHRDMYCCAYAMSPAAYMDGAPNLFDIVYSIPASEIPDLTIEVGTEDAVVYQMLTYLNGSLQQLALPKYNYIERPGTHEWSFWRECYPKFMTKLGEYFK